MLRVFISLYVSIEEGGGGRVGGRYLDFLTVWLLIDVVDIAGVAWVKVLVRVHLPFGCGSPPGSVACTGRPGDVSGYYPRAWYRSVS